MVRRQAGRCVVLRVEPCEAGITEWRIRNLFRANQQDAVCSLALIVAAALIDSSLKHTPYELGTSARISLDRARA
jgi:hypothetical protein